MRKQNVRPLEHRYLTSLSRIACATLLAVGATSTMAQSAFVAPDANFNGQVSASSATQGTPIVAGSEVNLNGRGFTPGQEVLISRGSTVLNAGAPYVADKDGNFKASVKLPADAAVGRHPIIVNASKPAAASVFELKVSPNLAISGADKFNVIAVKSVNGLYQVAYSAKNDTIFVAGAVGRPPVSDSQLVKYNAKNLEKLAAVTPAIAPAPARSGPPPGPAAAGAPAGGAQAAASRAPGVYAVYGVGVDDSNGTVWATNTRQNTVAVYKQSDLSLVKQFEVGAANHARDVVVDEVLGKAYVSTGKVEVFDTSLLQALRSIEVKSGKRGSDWGMGSLALDKTNHKLYVVSMSSDEVAVINTKTDAVEKVFAIPGVKSSIGIAYDPKTNRVFVASQGSDTLAIADVATGNLVKVVPVGAGALNAAFDPVKNLVYVSNRGAGTVTVLNTNGDIVANLDGGNLPNHLVADGKGNVFAVNKARGADDSKGDLITRFSAK